MLLWWSLTAWAGPCTPEVEALALALDQALAEARDTAEAVGLPLSPEAPPALLVDDAGMRVGLNFGPGACTASVGEVWIDHRPSRDLQIAHTVFFEGRDALEIRERLATKLDREAWLSVVTHEWLHLQHATHHEREWFLYRQRPLERRFLARPVFQKAVVLSVRAGLDAVADCAKLPELIDAWSARQSELSPRLARFDERWATTEGLARHTEVRWERAARGEAASEAAVAKACAVIDDGNYGYALGCVAASALELCGPEDWRERALATSLGEVLVRARPPVPFDPPAP